mmetsp:Transcript_2789/g.7812  ORF Transcript_2789/g.7812 Transcript_2789/m.7812 type:complete len:541 (-) Transcript_2789:32-1654(-)
MPKRKAKVTGFLLGDLLERSAIPTLSKRNQSMQSTPHIVDTGHEKAAPLVREITIPEGDLFCPEGASMQPSSVLSELGNADYFTYQNETKVQHLVAACLKDALRSLCLYDEFGVETEYSIFSLRPDIIVVSHCAKGIMLVVEVKKPGLGVFESHEVAGQVYDYLVGELLAGNATPFAVLSCYDEMCIAHLADDGASRDILNKNATQLNMDIDDGVLAAFGIGDGDGKAHQQNESAATSPQSKLNRVFAQNKPSAEACDNAVDMEDRDDEEDSDDEDWDRAVIYTQTFCGEQAIKALVLAIRCGLEAIAKSEPRNVPMGGESVRGSCARVSATGLVWGNMRETLRFHHSKFPGPTTRTLYLWRDLGRGSKGRVYLACNAEGSVCAVKFFLINDDTYHRQEGTKAERQAFREGQMKIKAAEANRERDYWLKVYGDTFKGQVRVVQLNNLWCLMMPYFDQVPYNERECCIDAIHDHLSRFKDMDLRYSETDLRWRHVGVRNGSPYIFDLGSLEVANSADINIDSSIDILRAKIDLGIGLPTIE